MAPGRAGMVPPGSGRGCLVLLAALLALETATVSRELDPPDLVYLPAELKVLDIPDHFRLQRVDRYLPGNASLGSRSETYLLLHRQPMAKPLVQATYLPFTAQQAVPAADPHHRYGSVAWDVRAVSIEGTVSPAEPYARVLFHLKGQDWLPGRHDLPCVSLHAFHQTQAAHGACHFQAPLGVCVVELEFPPHWFSATHPSSHSRSRAAEPAKHPERAELYYSLGTGETSAECSHAGPQERPRPGTEGTKERLHYVGAVELRATDPPRRQEVRLDDNVLIRVPDMALRPGQLFTATLILQQNFTADLLTLRIKVKKGLQVLAARPAVPEAWTAKLDKFKGSKHHTALVTCRRLDAGQLDWRAADFPEFLYLDLAVENGTRGLASTRPVTWQVEYPGQDPEAEKDKMVWEIQVSERDVRALVPLVKEQEIVNTAPLTGIPQAVPVKLVAVEMGGAVFEVTEQMGCESANKQVLKVTDACDSVYVGGKESRGARGARVDFWFRRLHASLLFTVWVPLLPLRVELTDTTLEQVRGWRVPDATPDSSGLAEPEEAGEEAERQARSCRLQYQRAGVRFLAHFVAHPLDGGRHLTYMPSPDWLLDVSHLVGRQAKVQDPRVATLEGGSVVIGHEPGVTSVEVRSPVSDSILGEQTLVVSDEKVAVLELQAQLVSGLSLVLSTEPGHPDVLTATCQALSALHSPKQEAALSVWLAFTDHTLAPMELYGWRDVALSVSSLDPGVAWVRPDEELARPLIVAKGPGRGPLLQLGLHAADSCRKGKHRAPLAAGTAWLEVGISRRLPTPGGPRPRNPRPESPFQRAEGAMSGEAMTAAATESMVGPQKWAPAGVGPDLTKFEGPQGGTSSDDEGPGEEEEEEIVKAPEQVTDLEIGMYVLLGVFCLAIFIFLINCIVFVLRYQRKEPPDAGPGLAPSTQQPHNWVWLGTDQEELSRQMDRCSQHQELSPNPTPDPSAAAKDGGCCCCGTPPGTEGGRREAGAPEVTEPDGGVSTSTFLPAVLGSPPPPSTLSRKELAAPGGRRKRVEFVTFASPRAPEGAACPPPSSAPTVQSILVASEDDIRWVCEDMGLRDPDELRSYMERIRGSS
ncbi:transmembrane protein 132A isoform X2 [Gopherus evgoodei]|uniref:transmembrane protein 132A isoform X2 n=1 Tax=Gopherus evgoodei TaxID=1825980 RepID=UPI0011CF2D43|nr:transmembrane protein 132A isoform X2 [Gopherus evgoodei]